MCPCVCVGLTLDNTLINTPSSPHALWIPLRKTNHETTCPTLSSSTDDVNTHQRTHTSACAHTKAYVSANRFSHKSSVRICVTPSRCMGREARTHMLNNPLCVTSGCLVTGQSTRQDSVRSRSATARISSVTKYTERHYMVGDCVRVCAHRVSTHMPV